jgi:predicted acylesterase/phospholipase RssA
MSPHVHYDGTSKYKVWEAVRASTSAPGYFEEYLLDGNVFQVCKEKFYFFIIIIIQGWWIDR